MSYENMESSEIFRKYGYSSDSLRMLESEEGQINAVFACFGSAAQHGQYYEKALSEFLATINRILAPSTPLKELKTAESQLNKKTIGQLLKIMNKHVKTDAQWVTDSWIKALEGRNFLIHRYFLEREDKFKTQAGRMAMLKELLTIETQLKEATDLVNGMRVAVVDQVSSNDTEKRENGSTLFTIEISQYENRD